MNNKVKDLEKQGYRLVGNHSAIKVCLWCKKSLRDEDVCYKKTFYNINSHRCMQSSVSLNACTLKCDFCWRDLRHTSNQLINPDNPKFIIDGFIKEHKEYLQGFGGNEKVNKEKFQEAMEPKHVALSLTGETCLYPKLPELIKEIHSRKMTSFVVSNGTRPDMIKKLTKSKPTQTYITLAAPGKETYEKVCQPTEKDCWDKLMRSLEIFTKLSRPTIRLTLVRKSNMIKPESYAKILKNINFKFLELKAAMPVGYAQYRMEYTSMPLHKEIKDFAKKICKLNDYKIIDEKENSRVVLLMEKDSNDRKLEIN